MPIWLLCFFKAIDQCLEVLGAHRFVEVWAFADKGNDGTAAKLGVTRL